MRRAGKAEEEVEVKGKRDRESKGIRGGDWRAGGWHKRRGQDDRRPFSRCTQECLERKGEMEWKEEIASEKDERYGLGGCTL
jgi:hypothetical protein